MEKHPIIPLLILTLIGLMAFGWLSGCNQYPAQKKPWEVGKTPLYFNKITPGYAPPLTVVSYQFDDFDNYDGSYHYFYSVKDANGRTFEHVIDYQLSEKK